MFGPNPASYAGEVLFSLLTVEEQIHVIVLSNQFPACEEDPPFCRRVSSFPHKLI
jgi:hypothetical protein